MSRQQPATRWRRGTVYVAVMGVTMIVAMLALAGATVGRLELRRGASRAEQQQARVLAVEGVNYAFNWLDKTPDWRTELTSGVASDVFYASGGGSFTFTVTDADGDLADDPEGGFVLKATGASGGAIACEEVEVVFTGQPLDCLGSALTVNSDITMPSGSLLSWRSIYGSGPVSANGNIQTGASFSKIDGDAWATGTVDGDIDGTVQENQSPPRTMPGPDVFDYYIANGTAIDVTALPTVGSARLIERQVISAASNPYGATNPKGIYVIDCGGENVVIKGGRLVATIVLLDNGALTGLDGSICWEPPAPGYPTLLVENDLRLQIDNTGPNEYATGINFNPPGTPYNGVTDNDTSDYLNPRLWGIVYCGGTLTVDQYFGPITRGAVICGQYDLKSIVIHNYDGTPYATPPPGFRTGGELQILPGSWRSVAN